MRSQGHNNQRFVRLRTATHSAAVQALRAAVEAKFPSVPVIDFFTMSIPRWEASWDGLHFSKNPSVEWQSGGFKCQWQGGASFMATTLFLYTLCLS